MLAMVGGIVLVDVAILVAFEVTDPLQLKPVNISETVRPYKVKCKSIVCTGDIRLKKLKRTNEQTVNKLTNRQDLNGTIG